MKKMPVLCALAIACALEGCRVADLGRSVAKTQKKTADGLLYADTLFTDDGCSRLTGSPE